MVAMMTIDSIALSFCTCEKMKRWLHDLLMTHDLDGFPDVGHSDGDRGTGAHIPCGRSMRTMIGYSQDLS